MSEPFPAKTMSDGELLTQSRVYRDEYQHWREQDGGTVAQGMTGRVMRSGLLKPGLEQKPLLNLNDGRRAPDWDEFTDQAAISILQGQPISPTPALPQQEQPERDTDPTAVTQTPARTAAATKQVWPNAWVANRLAHTYILHAKDGRDWPKMIVGLPRGTAIDGKDLTGWATDMFMSGEEPEAEERGTGRQHQVQTRHPGRAVHRPRSGTPHHAGRPADARPGGHRRAETQPRRRGDARHGIGGARLEDRGGILAADRTACRAGSRNTSVPARTSRPSQ